MAFPNLDKYRDLGLLLLRVGIGAIFIVHGVPKLMAGPEKWIALGGAMKHLGVVAFPAAWGFMAALSEALGGLLLALGLFARPAALFLFGTMAVAATMHWKSGHPFADIAHPLSLAVVFAALVLIGPGRFALRKG